MLDFQFAQTPTWRCSGKKETPINYYAAIILITEMWQNISGENVSVTRRRERRRHVGGAIYFVCKLNEPMHIGMQLLHPAATDHSVSISRQKVQCIFRFSLRSRAGIRLLSGGTAAMATGRDISVPSFRERGLHTEPRRSLSVNRSRRHDRGPTNGIPTKRPRMLPLPVSRGSLLCRYFLA